MVCVVAREAECQEPKWVAVVIKGAMPHCLFWAGRIQQAHLGAPGLSLSLIFYTVDKQFLYQLCYTNRNLAPLCPLPGQAQSKLNCPQGRDGTEQRGLQLELWTFVNTLKLGN